MIKNMNNIKKHVIFNLSFIYHTVPLWPVYLRGGVGSLTLGKKGEGFKQIITIYWSERCTTSLHLHAPNERQIRVTSCHIYFYCKGGIIQKY